MIVLLSTPVLDQMLTDQRFNGLECLQAPPRLLLSAIWQEQSCCGGKTPKPPPNPLPIDYNALKQRIDAASKQDKAQIRKLLEADLVVMQFKTPEGGIRKAEF